MVRCRRGWARRLTVMAAAAVMAAVTVPAATAADPPLLPPGRVPAGELGGAGPCTAGYRSTANPYMHAFGVSVFVPVGDAAAPTGGTCGDAARPLVVLAHGYAAMTPSWYAGLVEHLVSRGNVVVFPVYSVWYYPSNQYGTVDAGAVAGAALAADRVDPARLGVVGHSFGGGMVPWLVQQAASRGWGATSLWMMQMAPFAAFGVGTGAIEIPAHARALVVNFDDDRVADARLGIEEFRAFTLAADHKAHVMLHREFRGDQRVDASHIAPNTLFWPFTQEDTIDFRGIWRNADVLQTCADTGTACDADLGDMGNWSDGVPFLRATVSTDPVDDGPYPAFAECTIVVNPRRCPTWP